MTSLASHGGELEALLNGEIQAPRINQNGACVRILENLVELSLSDWNKFLDSERPIINFKKLTTLKLDNCSVRVDAWPEFLLHIPTLERLQMTDVSFYPDGNEKGLDWVLPFSMPRLKSLEIIGDHLRHFSCNKAFVDNLMGCPKLRQVHLKLDEKSTDEQSLVRLAKMDIALKMEVGLVIRGNDPDENAAVLDSSSRFKVVSIFRERMESFELFVRDEWDPQISKALEDVVGPRSNLTKFSIRLPQYNYDPSRYKIDSEQEKKRVNSALAGFFGASERALQLEDLQLDGNFDKAVISAVFENCLNLKQLKISDCPALRDQHLIDWISRDGGKLTHLDLFMCGTVTGEGIIPILAKSAETLLRIRIYPRLAQAAGRAWRAVLKNRCPFAQIG